MKVYFYKGFPLKVKFARATLLIFHFLIVFLDCFAQISKAPVSNKVAEVYKSGFLIDDFKKYDSFLSMKSIRLSNNQIIMGGTGDNGPLKVSWIESKFNIEEGFKITLDFSYKEVQETIDKNHSFGFELENTLPEAITKYDIYVGKNEKNLQINFGQSYLKKLPVDIFDGNRHKIILKFKRSKEKFHFLPSVTIDNYLEIESLTPILIYTNSDKPGYYYVKPSIDLALNNYRDELTIYAWNFECISEGSKINDEILTKFTSYITVDGNRYNFSSLGADLRSGFYPRRGKAQHYFEYGSTGFRNVNAPYLNLNFHMDDSEPLGVRDYSVTTRGGGPNNSVELHLGIPPETSEKLERLTGANTEENYSLLTSQNVKVTSIVRFDGTNGKSIEFTDLPIGDYFYKTKKHILSGRLFYWESQPFIKVKKMEQEWPKLVSFCNGKYKLQDEFSESEDKDEYHKYTMRRVICSKKDNPYCTVENVFQHMISNINYMAPASLEAITNPDGIVYEGNNIVLLPINQLDLVRHGEIILERINNGNQVCDCKENMLIGLIDTNPTSVAKNRMKSWEEKLFPQELFTFNKTNPIVNSVYPKQFKSVNRTLEGHFLHPGKVVRSVTEEDGQVVVNTVGTGAAHPELNNLVGKLFFTRIDNNLLFDFNIIAHIPKLQELIKNKTCPPLTVIKSQSIKHK